ncbi:MAG: hypothetical protein KF857_12235 [Fimbriimonadaceae bacterium]|nr:hypothetical protein [Fimbriimonadaceae bacterium]
MGKANRAGGTPGPASTSGAPRESDPGREDPGESAWLCPDELALADGTRLVSAYKDANGTKFWIITEADRSATTILLPEDY